MKEYQYTFESGVFETYSQVPPFEYYEVNQVHGDNILEITDLSLPCKTNVHSDGIVVKYSNFDKKKILPRICIKTADCLPVLVLGEKGYALIHAGWKGIQKKIVLQKLIKNICPTLFFLGPHIKVENYEVDANFVNNFPESQNILNENNQFFFNLSQEIKDQINAEFPSIPIIESELCTYSSLKLHSYRRNKTQKRNYNVFSPEF